MEFGWHAQNLFHNDSPDNVQPQAAAKEDGMEGGEE